MKDLITRITARHTARTLSELEELDCSTGSIDAARHGFHWLRDDFITLLKAYRDGILANEADERLESNPYSADQRDKQLSQHDAWANGWEFCSGLFGGM